MGVDPLAPFLIRSCPTISLNRGLAGPEHISRREDGFKRENANATIHGKTTWNTLIKFKTKVKHGNFSLMVTRVDQD